MESSRLIKAIEDGCLLAKKWIVDGEEDQDKVMMIEPYRTSENEVGFHFYGWGSALWRADEIVRRMLSHPDEFFIRQELRGGLNPPKNGKPNA